MIFFHLTDSALPNFCFVFLSLVNKSQEKNVLGLVFSVCNSPLERVLDLRRRSKVYPKLERAGLQSVNTLLKGYDNCTLKKKSTKAAQRSYLTFNVCWGRRTSNHRTIASCSFFCNHRACNFAMSHTMAPLAHECRRFGKKRIFRGVLIQNTTTNTYYK